MSEPESVSRWRKYWLLSRTMARLGWGRVAYQAYYRFSMKSGLRARRFPVTLSPVTHKIDPDFRANPVDFPFDSASLIERAEELCHGRMRYFSHQLFDVGDPPDWFRSPSTGESIPSPERHWTKIGDFNAGVGDIKYVWEASRFGWAPLLARAYRVSGNDRYLKLLQSWTVDWLDRNPVNQGPNWKCGQETSLRLINLLFAVYICCALDFHNSPALPRPLKSPWTEEWLRFFVREHLKRVAGNLRYAINQDNNHATSEAAALYLGELFLREALGDSGLVSLGRKGRSWLEKLSQRLIYDDGTFSQHSPVYHRLMLDTLSAALFWNRHFADAPFSDRFKAQFSKAIDWLEQMTDASGDVPNFGANDGALLIDWTACGYRDFRPSVGLAKLRLTSSVPALPPECAEALFWAGAGGKATTVEAAPKRSTRIFPDGGFIRIQGDRSWGLFRLSNQRDARPAHADALQFLLMIDGQNVLRDAGSFSYNTDPYWEHYFKSTAAHNTVTVADRDQMTQYSRFLWVDWTKAHLTDQQRSTDGRSECFEAQHDGYGNGHNGKLHRRAVLRVGDDWVVVDDLIGPNPAGLTLRWRLSSSDWQMDEGNGVVSDGSLSIRVAGGAVKLATAETDPATPWESLYYGERHVTPGLISRQTAASHRWVTLIGRRDNLPVYDKISQTIVFTGAAQPVQLSSQPDRNNRIVTSL